MQRIQAFVQLDRDINGVIYTPTQVIGRNLNAVATEYELSGDDLQSFWNGSLVTLYEENHQGQKEPVTIGVDLFSDTGVIVVPGTAAKWESTVRRAMPKYSFGNDGCWLNKNGHLTYVPEEEFTKWYDYNLVAHEFGFTTPNFESWLRGCPRVSEETFKKLQGLKNDLDDAIKEEQTRLNK
jgi:hypothetical protein